MVQSFATRLMNSWLMKPVRASIGQNLGNPGSHVFGRVYLKKFFEKNNSFVEQLAVKKCNIKPSDKVLELGFGPGIGIQRAAEYISKPDGGMVFGIDRSEAMVKIAQERLAQEIQEGRVELYTASVDSMPFNTHYIDKIFHCNCYYFWEDRPKCCSELLRVLKPGALMITTIGSIVLQKLTQNGILTNCQVDRDTYMEDLRLAGFVDVEIEEIVKGRDKIKFWIVHAKAPE